MITVDEQFDAMRMSQLADAYRSRDPEFILPSRSFFYQNRCPCVSVPVLQSCVDLEKSSLYHIMRALHKFIQTNRSIRDRLDTCNCEQHSLPKKQQWQWYLNKTVSDFIDSTCCARVAHHALTIGIGSSSSVPKLLGFHCVNNECEKCGIEHNLLFSKCKILSECIQEIDLLEWINAPRKGKKNKW